MKVLLLRFSSIGDIVLTTPIIRCIKQQLKEVELHYLTKENFRSILETNPYIDKLHTFSNSTDEVLGDLKKENFDLIIDLHKNIRTLKLKASLLRKNISFDKINLEKWLVVNTKQKKFLPNKHIVDRYFDGLKRWAITNDQKGLDFFITKDDEVEIRAELKEGFVAFAIGAQYATKKLPVQKMISILSKCNHPIVLLGGKEDSEISSQLISALPGKVIYDYCGKTTLRQSAYLVSKSNVLLTHDTGLMHIAAAFKTPIVSVWGNTIPEFGMYPYMPQNNDLYSIHEVADLKCRPCSKIGFQTCPKKHFDCMQKQDEDAIISSVEKRF